MTSGKHSDGGGSGRAQPRDRGAGSGAFVTIDGVRFGRIAGCDRMPPFLMSVASDTDLWMFISSRGGLSAGRVDPDGAVFPYETVDKLHDAHHHSGPVTVVRVAARDGSQTMWEPFADTPAPNGEIQRNLYKSVAGNQVIFEEVDNKLGLAIRYRWAGCDAFGLVRSVTLENIADTAQSLHVFDGVRNVLPYGAPLSLYQQSSSLVDAYKRSDLDVDTGLATFSLTSKIIDRAEAAESLRANTVWHAGLAGATVTLSAESLAVFRRGEAPGGEDILTGRRGNYFVASDLALEPGETVAWHLCVDSGRSQVDVAALRLRLRGGGDVGAEIERRIREAGENLVRNVASADGLELGADEATTAHHFANVLFNNMRGGVFVKNNDVPAADFARFLRVRNRAAAERHEGWLAALPAEMPVRELIASAADTGDANLRRLCHEYLPIYFGRRHGDPSRPWNRFSIRVKNADGSRALDYQGNWRDVFQNWEALCASFPAFIPNVIARFVNASTVDGFNPYRIMRDGIDWEVADPDDPWSYIGYWGDHQIIYLLKFLEMLRRYAPGGLEALLDADIFSYADVPYRIRPYAAIVANPNDTIEFDTTRAAAVAARVAEVGSDGKLVAADEGVYHVNLLEKLLVPVLAKLSNFIPGGGIWMNTQRPEWNDANNALVGNGVSVVTLCYLRRHLAFLEALLAGRDDAPPVSAEVVEWFGAIAATLEATPPETAATQPTERRRVMDALGAGFSDYRTRVYAAGFSGKRPLPAEAVAGMCRSALAHIDATIRTNRRDDGLYHAYNLLRLGESDATLEHLYEMLEGQVAALSSGVIAPDEAADLVDALFESDMYRPDQKSFMLYPARELPAFMDRNVVDNTLAEGVPLLRALLAAKDTSIVQRDAEGAVRFHGDFHNAGDVAAALDALARDERWRDAIAADRGAVLDVFEAVFDHHAFTGRSGTMYAYEGLGSIYWHMVAKLMLAVQENALRAIHDAGADDPTARRLAGAYHRIRDGLGFRKTAAEYGAFPTDPYSHSPAHAGAQQPGMTGQVKEEILTRFGELGVEVKDGCVRFRPALLDANEYLGGPATFDYVDVHGEARRIDVPAGSLAFTFCQVPVVYRRASGGASVRVTAGDGGETRMDGDGLDAPTSAALFARAGAVGRVDVYLPG